MLSMRLHPPPNPLQSVTTVMLFLECGSCGDRLKFFTLDLHQSNFCAVNKSGLDLGGYF